MRKGPETVNYCHLAKQPLSKEATSSVQNSSTVPVTKGKVVTDWPRAMVKLACYAAAALCQKVYIRS